MTLEQPSLFDGSAPYHRDDPWTSKAAAGQVDIFKNRLAVLTALGAAPNGLTDWELSLRTGQLRTAAGTRRKELQDRGLVADTEEARPTDTGRWAKVHVISDAGLRLLGQLATPKDGAA